MNVFQSVVQFVFSVFIKMDSGEVEFAILLRRYEEAHRLIDGIGSFILTEGTIHDDLFQIFDVGKISNGPPQPSPLLTREVGPREVLISL